MKIDNTFILYFSLPFSPIRNRSFFFNGHLALQLGGEIYQIFDPRMLKSDFLVSTMPIKNWLSKADVRWVGKDPNKKKYRWVNLYNSPESKRTIIYSLQLKNVTKTEIIKYKKYFTNTERKFQEQKFNFNIFKNNCATILKPVLKQVGLLNKKKICITPAKIFKSALKNSRKITDKYHIKKIDKIDNNKFYTKKICLGIFSLNAEKHMDKYILSLLQNNGGERKSYSQQH